MHPLKGTWVLASLKWLLRWLKPLRSRFWVNKSFHYFRLKMPGNAMVSSTRQADLLFLREQMENCFQSGLATVPSSQWWWSFSSCPVAAGVLPMVAPSVLTINLCGGSMVLFHDSFRLFPKWLIMLNIFPHSYLSFAYSTLQMFKSFGSGLVGFWVGLIYPRLASNSLYNLGWPWNPGFPPIHLEGCNYSWVPTVRVYLMLGTEPRGFVFVRQVFY